MIFYKIENSIESKQVGTFPQVETGIYPLMDNNPIFIGNNYFKYIPIKPDVTFPILRKKAKKTDLISASIMGLSSLLTISNKLKDILEKYENKNIQFFKTHIIHKEIEDYNYWIGHPYRADNSFIDFSKSIISRRNIFSSEPKEYVVITDAEDFEMKMTQKSIDEKTWGYKVEKLVLTNAASDFFILRGVKGGIGYYISEKVKKEIEEAGCTGIEFEPVSQD